MENENNKNMQNDSGVEETAKNSSVCGDAVAAEKPTEEKQKATKKKRKKKKSSVFSMIMFVILITFVLFLVIGGIAAYQIWNEYSHTDCGEESVVITIPQGASGAKIASILKENGVIKNELAFRLKIRNSPYRNELNYGKFTLKKNMPYNYIIEELRKPSALREGISVTIPEGYSAEMIAKLFEEKGFCTMDEFLKELSEGQFNYDFIKDIPDTPGAKYKLQGYLFPSTHYYAKDAGAHEIIDTLLCEFEKQYNSILGNQKAPMPMHEVIVRASLIEREAKLDNERPIISGVIQNRVVKGMILGIDASVLYVATNGMYDRELEGEELEIESQYNIRKYEGFPPGPICNPGIKSIAAAMYPESHNYLYYHTDTQKNDGSHIFTETYEQHKNTMR